VFTELIIEVAMKRRAFLRLSSALVAGTFCRPSSASGQSDRLTNWAGNVQYSTNRVDQAASLEDVQRLVKSHDRLKGLGTRHCFNRIADSRDRFVALTRLNNIVALDPNRGQVTVEAGITYGQLCPYLHEKGFALHNLASLPHISVGGACATATHGSGVTNGNLATPVRGLEIVRADGSVVTLSADGDREKLNASVVSLGALGIVTKVTLAVQPTFSMRQYVYERLPLSQLKENFHRIMSAGYSVSLFTDWQRPSVNEVWVKSRVDAAAPPEADLAQYGATRATKNLHPIAELSAVNCTEQMGVPGPWFERMPHFRMGFTPSSGQELQAEYFVPNQHGIEAILTISRLGARIAPHLFISEVRTVAADDLWMSPCYKQGSVAIHFTWKPDWAAVRQLLPVIEKELAPFKARPHWGKLFSMDQPALAKLYERLPDFRRQVAEFDPRGKFRNEFLNTYILGLSNIA
jgi:alditol oxidase